MKTIWEKWTTLTKKFARFIAGIVLVVVFCLIFIPLSIVIKLFFKNALLGHTVSLQKNSFWIKRTKTKHDLSFASEQ